MKTIYHIISLFILALSCLSCDTDLGFPDTVKFGNDGGVKTFTGNTSLISIQVLDYNGNGNSDDNNEDILTANYRWLTVESARDSHEIKITAEPNNGRKQRKLYVHICDGPNYAEIKVKQSGR